MNDKPYFESLLTLNYNRYNMIITDKEKLWYGTILVVTAVLSIYSFVTLNKQLPVINEALVTSQDSLDDIHSQLSKEDALLLLLQKNLTIVSEYTTEKIVSEKKIAAIKSICGGLKVLIDADAQRKQGKLAEAAVTLKADKETFWKAGDVLKDEQANLRALMNPIDVLMAEWGKGNKSADASALATAVKVVLKKVDPIAEYCPINEPIATPVIAEKKEQPAKNDAAIKILCTSYQQLAAAEKQHQQNDLTGAATKLKTVKDSLWQASEVFTAEQTALRDLMEPFDVIIGRWNAGDKAAETNAAKESIKNIIRKAGGQPEACPALPEEKKPQPVAVAPAPKPIEKPKAVAVAPPPVAPQAPVAYAAAQPAAYAPPPAAYTPPPAAYAPPINTTCTVAKESPQTGTCTFTSDPADYTPTGSLHCLRISLEKIITAETKHREGDLLTAAKILKTSKHIIWRSGDNLIPEQPALGALMIPIDNIVTQWEKGNTKAETTVVTAKLTEIVQRLEKTSS